MIWLITVNTYVTEFNCIKEIQQFYCKLSSYHDQLANSVWRVSELDYDDEVSSTCEQIKTIYYVSSLALILQS